MPATTSSAIIPIPPGNNSNFLIGPNLVISKNLNNKNDNVNDIVYQYYYLYMVMLR